jgi:hypothetical protein
MEYIWCFERELGEMCLLTKSTRWIKKKPVLVGIICTILVASVALWQMSQVTEAAILNPHPGLVGWWRFDEGTGIIAKDNSIYGNHGTISGAIWVTGKYGEALRFNGASDYVEIAHASSLAPTSGISLEAWVNVTRLNTMEVILTKSTAGKDVWQDYALTHEANNIFRGIFVVAGNTRVVNSLPHTNTNVWYHIVTTFDGQSLKMYVNGVLEGTATYAGALGTSTNALRIGKQTVYNFQGVIDEIRIYNRALSAAEIQTSFQESPDFSSRLLAKVPKGTTQVIATLSWQGVGPMNVTIQSPTTDYNETTVPVYQKTTYSTSEGTYSMLNVKRLSVSVTALSSDQDWYVVLTFTQVEDYRITIEIQK